MLSPSACDVLTDTLAPVTVAAYRWALTRLEAALNGEAPTDHSIDAALDRLIGAGLLPSCLDQMVAAVCITAAVTGTPDSVGPSCAVILRRHRRRTGAARQVAAVD